MEQYELKLILESIFEYEFETKSMLKRSKTDGTATKLGVKDFFNQYKEKKIKAKIYNRLRKIYGKDHANIAKYDKL
jgi:hypothetical protein